jgi:hypothetical protein
MQLSCTGIVLRLGPETVSSKTKGGINLHPSFYVGSGMKKMLGSGPWLNDKICFKKLYWNLTMDYRVPTGTGVWIKCFLCLYAKCLTAWSSWFLRQAEQVRSRLAMNWVPTTSDKSESKFNPWGSVTQQNFHDTNWYHSAWSEAKRRQKACYRYLTVFARSN